jgi:hypothetical protein
MRSQRDVAITAVSVAELLMWARRLAEGCRRERLIAAIEKILVGSRVLALDDRAARIYARMQERRRTAGYPLSIEDGMIAAITVAHGAALATRNTADFEGLHLSLINRGPTTDELTSHFDGDHGVPQAVVSQPFVGVDARVRERGILVPAECEYGLIHVPGVEHAERHEQVEVGDGQTSDRLEKIRLDLGDHVDRARKAG